MKIGKFSSENNISIDTIRHYMNLGLITPEKLGGHYDFDERCKKDLQEIINLKELGFTLSEIKSIFLFKKLGKLTPYQENECFKEFFINKLNKVNNQLKELPKIKLKLEEKIKELSLKECKEDYRIGIHIDALSLLKCPQCGNELILNEGKILNNQIIKGKLKCDCNEEYLIEDGILFINKESNYSNDNIDYNYFTEEIDNRITEYINETDPDYLINIYKGLEWAQKKLDFREIRNKVMLDLGSGFGFLLRYIYNDMPDDILYVAIDHDIRCHNFLKKVLEKADCRRKVIFICCDFLEIPLKDKTVDILIDNTGSSNYGFEHEDFLLKLIDNYVKDDAFLLGAYILFKRFSINSFIEDKFKKNFILNNIREEIKKLHYKVIDERTSDILDKGGKYENYFKADERVYSYMFYGKR